jgi:hypothetical protein
MYDASEVQDKFKQYSDRFQQIGTQFTEMNIQFGDDYLKRQSSFFSELSDAGSQLFEQLGSASSLENIQQIGGSLGEDLKTRFSEFSKESMVAYNEHQEQLKSLYESLNEQESSKEPKAKKVAGKLKASS